MSTTPSPSTLTDDVLSINLTPTNDLIALKQDKFSSITSPLTLNDVLAIDLSDTNDSKALKPDKFPSITSPLTLTDDDLFINLTPTND